MKSPNQICIWFAPAAVAPLVPAMGSACEIPKRGRVRAEPTRSFFLLGILPGRLGRRYEPAGHSGFSGFEGAVTT